MGSKKKKTEQTYTPPSWVSGTAQRASGIANRIAGQQYQAYDGERVAGLSQNEQAGMQMARDTAGAAQPYYDQSAALAERGSQQFADADMSQYMNPYIENALDPAARKIREEGSRQQMALDSRSASMNAFGGSRAALMQQGVTEGTLEATSDLYKTGLADAYKHGVSIWGDERARDMQASGRFQDLGTSVSNANKTDIATLMATGATDRSIQQSMKDFDYQQFVEERDWDFRSLGALIASLEGTKGSYETKQTSTETTSGGELGQALGLAATLIGTFYGAGGGAKDPTAV
jgi:hypothetical protein